MLRQGEATMPPTAMGQKGGGETAPRPRRNATQENFLKALAAEQERAKAHSTPLPVETIHQGEENNQDAAAQLMKELMSQAPPLPAEKTVTAPPNAKKASETPPVVMPPLDLKNTTKNVSQEQVNSFMKSVSEGFKATLEKIKSFGKSVVNTISASKFWDRVFGS